MNPPTDNNFLRPLITVLMTGIIMFAVMVLLELLDPGWHGQFIVVVAMFATLEGYVVKRLFQLSSWLIGQTIRLRVTEAVLFFLLLQVGARLNDGRWFVGEFPDAGSPIIVLLVVPLIVLCWLAGMETSDNLKLLALPPEDRVGEDPAGQLVRRFGFGGAILLICAGLSKIGLLQLLRPASDVSLLVLLVLLYFVLGVVLLASVHYSTMRIAWLRQGRAISGVLGQTWLRYSLIFLGLVAAFAFLLPTDYSSGLLDILGLGLGVILALGTYILALILFLFALLLAPLVGLVHQGANPPQAPPPPVLPMPPPGEGGGDWVELAKSLLFWIVTLALAIAFFRTYVWHNKALAAFVARIAPLAWLVRGLGTLWQRLTGMGRGARKRLRQLTPKREQRAPVGAARRTRRGGSTLRDEVRGYYLRVLDRAAAQGWPRQPPETPYEYKGTLAPHVAPVQDDLAALTQAFVEASYSPHEPQPTDAADARARAERIDNALTPQPEQAKPNGSKPA